MAWKAYEIMPIDFRWEMLPTVPETAAQLGRIAANEALEFGHTTSDVDKFLRDFDMAKGLAKAAGWEGDFRHEPQVFWVPDENTFEYGFVWKQDNNGTTFVVSPRPLKWLDELG